MTETFIHDSDLPDELCPDMECPDHHAPDWLRLDALTGTLLHRAWLASGRPDPLIDSDAWDGFALTIRAVARVERIVVRRPDDRWEPQAAEGSRKERSS